MTSRLIATWRLMYTVLDTAAVAGGFGAGFVILGGSFDPGSEGILLPGAVVASDESRPTFFEKEELFTLRSIPFTALEGKTGDEALSRLEAIADLIQNAVRDSSGKPSSYFQTALGSTYARPEVTSWLPALSGTPRSVTGRGNLDIEFKVRI